MRPEGGKAVGGAGSPCGKGADAAGSVISAESAPCEVLDVEGACWATLVVAAGASAKPVPPPEGTEKTETKAVSVAGKKISTAGTAIVGDDGGSYRSDEFPRSSRVVVNSHTWPVRAKIAKIRRGERQPTQNSARGVGYQPTQTNTRDWRGPGAKSAGPDEEDTAIIHGDEVARSSAVVFRRRLWQTGQKIGISVGATLAVLEGVVERCEQLEPPLDSRIVIPHFANAFERLVIREDAKLRAP